MNDLISRSAAIKALDAMFRYTDNSDDWNGLRTAMLTIEELPSEQQQYKPVTAEDFAKTMSENTIYGFIAWHRAALELMEKQGFIICKKMM